MNLNEANLDQNELEIYREAQGLLRQGTDATAFSARFFGATGRLAMPESSREERQAVMASDLYRWLKLQHARLRKQGAATFEQEVVGKRTEEHPRGG